MAVDLDFIEGMVEMQGSDCYFKREVILEMVQEITDLRIVVGQRSKVALEAFEEIITLHAEIAEYRASIKCKQETVNWKDHT